MTFARFVHIHAFVLDVCFFLFVLFSFGKASMMKNMPAGGPGGKFDEDDDDDDDDDAAGDGKKPAGDADDDLPPLEQVSK
jgi:hypothetical protein